MLYLELYFRLYLILFNVVKETTKKNFFFNI